MKETIRAIQKVAYWLAIKGLSEANAGNISVRIDEVPNGLEVKSVEEYGFDYNGPEMFILVTATGSRMREIYEDDSKICLVHVLPGKTYEILHGEGKPTSEFPTHLMIHARFKEAGSKKKAIVHTHPLNLLTLMNLSDFHELIPKMMKIHPEVLIFFQNGISVVEFERPGSVELGLKTVEKSEGKDAVLWDKHGVVAFGRDVAEAYDKIEILEKAADILLKILSLGRDPTGVPGGWL
ncbi:rhamnulose-1-phosphate aldolase [Thermotoga sp. KOL6]|uniref:rhamnulose-1-phosphate aldolase n=1 Tax=Thermotoga sp. KOL6 TaxID=126741 RepID=UPI000C77608F|nr:rhamnulose-1-phosphate aldolase [Thermotoga sp. KOL6]PLV59812.1 rhamnulose-1-phosphate aldolase [Thermotoga sp. KOL6]